MGRSYQTLLDILTRLRDLHEELLAAMIRAHDALANYRARELDEYNKTVEALKIERDALESARRHVVEQLVRPSGRAADGVTLSELIAGAPLRLQADLIAVRSDLTTLFTRMAEQNEHNRRVAAASIVMLQGLGHVLRNAFDKPLTYRPPAAKRAVRAAAGHGG
ncbi:MAG: flagellar protein FlgN [Deltaproteobacteria bacterium]|nr:flagellar protein FlgN [Deltaproteobacteria bacterium]